MFEGQLNVTHGENEWLSVEHCECLVLCKL